MKNNKKTLNPLSKTADTSVIISLKFLGNSQTDKSIRASFLLPVSAASLQSRM